MQGKNRTTAWREEEGRRACSVIPDLSYPCVRRERDRRAKPEKRWNGKKNKKHTNTSTHTKHNLALLYLIEGLSPRHHTDARGAALIGHTTPTRPWPTSRDLEHISRYPNIDRFVLQLCTFGRQRKGQPGDSCSPRTLFFSFIIIFHPLRSIFCSSSFLLLPP